MHPTVLPQQKWAENWEGGSVPFLVSGDGSPSSTMWPGPRPTYVPSAILIYPAIWPRWTWAENGRGLRPVFGEGELGPHVT